MKTIFFGLLALLFTGSLNAQTVDDIIAKHTEAIGGKAKLSQINSVYMESGIEVMGTDAPTKTFIMEGKGYRSETNFNGSEIINVVTDKSAWAVNPFGGMSSPTALSADMFKLSEDQIYTTDPLVNYAAHGAKAELIGQEKVGTANNYKIKYTNKDNISITYFIDASTYLISQVVRQGESMGQEVTVTTVYSNYKKTDYGNVVPFNSDIDMGQMTLKMSVSKVEVNKTIDPAIFMMGK